MALSPQWQNVLDDGNHVGLVGRRAEPLEATAGRHGNGMALPCDDVNVERFCFNGSVEAAL